MCFVHRFWNKLIAGEGECSNASSFQAATFVIQNALNSFLEKIKQIDEITECYIITGEADFLIKILCKDIPTYEQLLFKTLSQIEEIERLKTLMTLSTVKDSKILPYRYER